MTFIIDNEILQKCGGGSSEYWFSYKDYKVKNIYELSLEDKPDGMGQTTYFVSIGLIPFVSVSNEEIMRGFVKEKGTKKLVEILENIKGEEFIETFWKYFNAYPELKDGLDVFADKFVKTRIESWCVENNIQYKFDI